MSGSIVLSVAHASFRYGEAPVLSGIDLEVASGELLGIIGPNGSGKSTLLSLLLGIRQPEEGRVLFRGEPLSSRRRREIAQRMALVPQDARVAFPFTVREIVMMGRYPHLSRFGFEGRKDRDAVESALEATKTTALGDRPYDQLSGGEKQRVLLASALAQGAEILFLDEPTASLDIRFQVEMFRLLARLHGEGQTIVAALHDLNLAARFCDRVALLWAGKLVAVGPPRDVLTKERLESVYGTAVHVHELPGSTRLIAPDYGAPA